MKIFLHKNFKKKYKRLREEEKKKFKERRNLFFKNPLHPILNNHELSGKQKKYRSINITGDLRVIYESLGKNKTLFITIDTHSNLYK